MFATKPELAGRLLQHAHDLGIRAGFVAGDEVYGGLGLRQRSPAARISRACDAAWPSGTKQ